MDWSNDDRPYPFTVATGSLVSVPYSLEVNDILIHTIEGGPRPELKTADLRPGRSAA